MKFIPTKKQEINSKKGQFVTIHGISEEGDALEIFINKEQADKYKVQNLKTVKPDILAEMFKDLPVAQVEYGSRGQFVGLTIDDETGDEDE